MGDDNPGILGGTADERFSMQLEEARKRGTTSPAGLFALLGELDYYQLIENLIQGPITERQLITPYRWWLFFKGNALASIVGMILIMMRFSLLLPGQNLSFEFKYSFFLGVYAMTIFAYGYVFLKYTEYPGGATWTAVKYTLAGFSSGVVIAETFKTFLACLSILGKQFVAQKLYGHWRLTDAILELYYDSFVRGIAEELATLAVCYIIVIYFWMYFYRKTAYRKDVLTKGHPYDLASDS